MLITFRSQAAADVMMFGDVAMQMLRIIGKDPANRGIVTAVQLPAAIAALRHVIATDTTAQTKQPAHGQVATETEPDDSPDLVVSTSQRAQPLLELFEWSLKADKPVIWED